MKTESFLGSIVMALALLVGCTDTGEQALRQVQKDLERVLRTELRNGGVLMQRVGDHLTIILTERLLFDAGSQEIKPDGLEVLKQMGGLFKTVSFREIRVAGHADKPSVSDHSNQYFENLALSKARATHTGRVLKGDRVDSQSFIVEWYGGIRPIASNETEDGRQLNRRVEIVLYARGRSDALMSELKQ